MKMKISQYAKLHGVTTRTVWNWIYKGEVNIERTKTNRVLIVFNENEELSTAIYCRVSSSENKNNLESQKNRLIIMRKVVPNVFTNGIEDVVVHPRLITI